MDIIRRAGRRSTMELRKIGWVGTRTENPEATADFFGRVLGLRFSHSGDGVWVFQLPDASKVEVFGPSENQHFTTGPVVEFLTGDVAVATEELLAAGVPIVSGPVYWQGDDDVAWVHFRAPDGNIYGITQGRDLEPPG
jgi:catechol 2,3-dioxygenase-like lactoylglutathione lyase family enzyme